MKAVGGRQARWPCFDKTIVAQFLNGYNTSVMNAPDGLVRSHAMNGHPQVVRDRRAVRLDYVGGDDGQRV